MCDDLFTLLTCIIFISLSRATVAATYHSSTLAQIPVFTWCSTTAGRFLDSSSSLKCAQQRCLIHNSHCSFLIWYNIFPGHSFFSSMKHWTSYFKTLVQNWKFHIKGMIFTHPSLPVIPSLPIINMNHSHWQLFWRPNTQQWGQLAVALLRRTPDLIWNLRTAGAEMLLSTMSWSLISPNWQSGSLWRGKFDCHKKLRNCLKTNKRMLLIRRQLKCAAWEAQKPWDTSRLGCWRYWRHGRCWRGCLIWQYQCLYWHVLLVQGLKTMMCAFVCIGACIGLF